MFTLRTTLGRVALSAALAGSGALALGAGTAQADEITCRGRIGSRTIDGDVNVPRGATCTLDGTRVDGNVFVRDDARAELIGARLTGNVQAEGARNVIVRAELEGERIRAGGERRCVISEVVVRRRQHPEQVQQRV